MKLSREEVVHIAALARMGISDAEIEKAREQLSNILENFDMAALDPFGPERFHLVLEAARGVLAQAARDDSFQLAGHAGG